MNSKKITSGLLKGKDMERFSFEKACSIIYKHFGRENVEQVQKPDGKNFYIVSTLLNGIANTKVMYKADILALR